MGWTTEVQFPAGAGIFFLCHCIQSSSGAHSPSYPMGTRSSFLEVRQLMHEADHSPPSSAEVFKQRIHVHGMVLS
jgi:hypothetical protein